MCVCAFFGNKRLKLRAQVIDKRKRHWIIRLMILNISLLFHFIHFCIESLNTFLLLSLAFCAVAIVDFHIIYSQNVTTHIFFLLCHNVYVFLLKRKSVFFLCTLAFVSASVATSLGQVASAFCIHHPFNGYFMRCTAEKNEIRRRRRKTSHKLVTE